jgi:peptidoglycan/LPS O-acetylase OafA/YrhL
MTVTNWVIHPPVDLALLAFGVGILVGLWPERRFRVQYMVLAVLFVGASFLPLLGFWSTDPMQDPTSSDVLALCFGLYLLAGGVFDHLLLVRTMKSLPEEDDGRAV